MAALVGYGVDNVLVEVDADEVPVMDGSSRAYIDAIDQVGLRGPGCAAPLHPCAEAGSVQNGRQCWRVASI